MSTTTPKYLIIDTCIIQYASNSPDLATKIGSILQEAAAAEYIPAISHFTYFELLDGASPTIEAQRTNAVLGVKRFRFQERVIRLAARLACFYREEGWPDDRIRKVMKDRIIAATCALSYGSLLYTANANDFPQPFFEVIDKRPIAYHQKNDKVIYTYFIQPDYQALVKALKQWKTR